MIRNLANGSLLANRATVARHPVARLIGLLNRSHLPDGEALILPHCRSIHTIGMRCAIDVAFVKTLPPPVSSGETLVEVVAVAAAVRPWRLAWAAGADTAVELPEGALASTSTAVGHQLAWKTRIAADQSTSPP